MGLRCRVPPPGPFYYSAGGVSWGARSSDWHCVLRLVIAWGGGYALPRFSWCFGGDGLTCTEPNPQCDGRLTSVGWTGGHRGLRLKAIGGKTASRNTTKTNHGERGDIMSMRHAAPRNSNVATRRPLKRSSEIILAAIIYLTASCFAVAGTLGVVAAIWVLWGALGIR